jgi:dTDP-4-dehydrorhamnose 3,5-epimerase
MSETWLLKGAKRDPQSVTSDWQPTNLELIEGVQLREIRPVLRRGRELTEIYRADWFDAEDRVGQVFQVDLRRGEISAWHAHGETIDRLFVAAGAVRIVLFDSRPESTTLGKINELVISARRPTLVVVPPKVWHGVHNVADGQSILLNIVDRAYSYEAPDHYRVAVDCPEIDFRF